MSATQRATARRAPPSRFIPGRDVPVRGAPPYPPLGCSVGTRDVNGSRMGAPQDPHDAAAPLALRTGLVVGQADWRSCASWSSRLLSHNADHELGPPAVMWRWECLPIRLGVADTPWHTRSGP